MRHLAAYVEWLEGEELLDYFMDMLDKCGHWDAETETFTFNSPESVGMLVACEPPR